MTTEQKAKAYDNAVVKIRHFIDGYSRREISKEFLADLFPELKESEDERIRKELIDFLEYYRLNNVLDSKTICLLTDSVAWLEKQGEPVEINPTEFDIRLQALIGKFDSLPKEELIGSLSFWLNVVQNDGTYKPDEGQGEQKPADKVGPKFHEGDLIRLKDGDGLEWTIKEMHHDGYYTIVCEDREDFIYLDNRWELVGKLVDMNEPKFHEGDWVVDNECGKVNQITSVRSKGYDFANGDYMSYESAHKELRLWDISDAKDGDVLYCESSGIEYIIILKQINNRSLDSYCRYNTIDGFAIDVPRVMSIQNNPKPATKEQRDTLLRSMKEAGYEWNPQKKELKKIELTKIESEEELSDFEAALFTAFSDAWQQYLIGEEVNVAQWAKEHSAELLEEARKEHIEWSEEDEKNLQGIIDEIQANKSSAPSYDINVYDRYLNWLKSLKHQNTWKPSKEQIEALHDLNLTGDISYMGQARLLIELYNDLKKLTE